MIAVPKFQPGFRLSVLDLVILAVGACATVALAPDESSIGFVIAFVTGHFFLFCNVFRIARRLELVWGAAFTLLVGATETTGYPGWSTTIAISLTMTIVVVAVEMRKPSYHGVCWRRINPNLRTLWDSQWASTAERMTDPAE